MGTSAGCTFAGVREAAIVSPESCGRDTMNAWHEFYDVVAGVAATLLGLLFVSVSLNAEAILGSGNKHSKRLAEQAFQNYLGVLVIALLVLIPGISEKDFGVSL